MINRVVLIGRITKDLELKQSQSGTFSCKFTVAVNRQKSNNNNEPQSDFINCVAFGKNAENLAKYQGKGSLIGLEGRIQTGSYVNQQNQKVYTTEVIADSIQYLSSNSKQQGNNQGYQQQQGNQGYQQQQYPPQQQYQQQQYPPQQQFQSQQQYQTQQQFQSQQQQQYVDVSEQDLPF